MECGKWKITKLLDNFLIFCCTKYMAKAKKKKSVKKISRVSINDNDLIIVAGGGLIIIIFVVMLLSRMR